MWPGVKYLVANNLYLRSFAVERARTPTRVPVHSVKNSLFFSSSSSTIHPNYIQEGQRIEYTLGTDEQGRVKATRVTGPYGALLSPIMRGRLRRDNDTANGGAAATTTTTTTVASFGAPSPNQGVPADMEIHDMDLPELELDDNEEAELESLQSCNTETHHDDNDENFANKD